MRISLRRFNQAYARQCSEDGIIDLTIALESCLLRGIRYKLKGQLSIRGAALLAHLRDPQKTRALLKVMYEVRSEIAHDGRLFSDDEVQEKIERFGSDAARDFLHACEDVTREILREYVLRLAAGCSLAELSEELDRRTQSGF